MLTLAGPGSSPPRPIRREIRRFAASICLPHETRGYLPGLGDKGRAAVGRAGSFNSGKNVTRNRYFRSEGLKGREPEGTLFFRTERSGPPDGGSAFPNRPLGGKEIQMSLFRPGFRSVCSHNEARKKGRISPASSPQDHTYVLVHFESCLQGLEIPATEPAHADSDIRAEQPLRAENL